MQVRPLSGKANRLYLDDAEYQLVMDRFVDALDATYVRATDHMRFKRGARMMGEAGFRFDGINELVFGTFYSPKDLEITFMRLYDAKATSDRFDEGKRRDAWVPADLKSEIDAQLEERDAGRGDQLFFFSYSTFKNRIKAVGEFLAEETGNKDWEDLRPHDLRAYFANSLLDRGVPESVVMWLGGWDDKKTFRESYKRSLRSREIQNSLARANVIDVEPDGSNQSRRLEEQLLAEFDDIMQLLLNIMQRLDDLE